MSDYHGEAEPEGALPELVLYFTPSAFPAQELHSALRIPRRAPSLTLSCPALPTTRLGARLQAEGGLMTEWLTVLPCGNNPRGLSLRLLGEEGGAAPS